MGSTISRLQDWSIDLPSDALLGHFKRQDAHKPAAGQPAVPLLSTEISCTLREISKWLRTVCCVCVCEGGRERERRSDSVVRCAWMCVNGEWDKEEMRHYNWPVRFVVRRLGCATLGTTQWVRINSICMGILINSDTIEELGFF